MPEDANFHHLHKAIHKIGSYYIYINESCLITIDHWIIIDQWIIIGCNTFYGHPEHPVMTQPQLNKLSKYFCLHASGLLCKAINYFSFNAMKCCGYTIIT